MYFQLTAFTLLIPKVQRGWLAASPLTSALGDAGSLQAGVCQAFTNVKKERKKERDKYLCL